MVKGPLDRLECARRANERRHFNRYGCFDSIVKLARGDDRRMWAVVFRKSDLIALRK